jgi:hypothetical protein
LRIFDPTGRVHAEVRLAGIAQRGILVTRSDRADEADVSLPLTKAGKADFCALTQALGGGSFAMELRGRVYSIDERDYTSYRSIGCDPGSSVEIRVKPTTPQALVRALRVAKIVDVSVGSQRFFFTSGPNGASCEIDFDMPDLGSEVWCLSYAGGRPYRTALAVAMSRSGKLRPCHGLGCIGNAPLQTPTLRYGKSVILGPFRCTALRAGTRCVVTKTGRGFLLGAHRLKRV